MDRTKEVKRRSPPLVAILGMGLIGAGCWWINPPLALVVVGGVLLVDFWLGG